MQAGQVLTPLGESTLHTHVRAKVYCASVDEGGSGEWISGSKPGRLVETLEHYEDEYSADLSEERAQIYLNGVGVEGVVDLDIDGGIIKSRSRAEARIRLSIPVCIDAGSSFTVYLGGDLIGFGTVSELTTST